MVTFILSVSHSLLRLWALGGGDEGHHLDLLPAMAEERNHKELIKLKTRRTGGGMLMEVHRYTSFPGILLLEYLEYGRQAIRQTGKAKGGNVDTTHS